MAQRTAENVKTSTDPSVMGHPKECRHRIQRGHH